MDDFTKSNQTDDFFSSSSNSSSSSITSGLTLDLIKFQEALFEKLSSNEVNRKYKAIELGLNFKDEIKTYKYGEDEKPIVVCPEPLVFLKEFNDVSDSAIKTKELFLEKMKGFKTISLEDTPELAVSGVNKQKIWINDTASGINLRPGLLNNERDGFKPIKMSDDNVHGLIVGRTGAGKSVYINALILSLITEYPPWELDLYLADFKKVELSRYMNDTDKKNEYTAFTPHINACAATSEIRYVCSLIKYLVDCMVARQEFFSRLGVTKIQEFRSLGVCLPRVLLVVDEFQQLFTEATNKEATEIQNMLNTITKLGRATGFHLIFASQEMSGTISGSTLGNFKIKMALPCNPEVSSSILGNKAAGELERGYVLVNTESGNEKKNLKYRVPFIQTDSSDDEDAEKSDFYKYLDMIKLNSKKFDLTYKSDSIKFYKEELQETEKEFLNDLDKIKDNKNDKVNASNSIFDAVLLGKSVLYSPKQNDKDSLYLEKGRNKGIMIAGNNPDDVTRVRKLLSENFLRSNLQTCHLCLELNPLVSQRYSLENAIREYPNHQYIPLDANEGLAQIQLLYDWRKTTNDYFLNPDNLELNSLKENYTTLKDLIKDENEIEKYNLFINEKEELEEKIINKDREIVALKTEIKKDFENPLTEYHVSFLAEFSEFDKEFNSIKESINKFIDSTLSNISKTSNDNQNLKTACNECIKIFDDSLNELQNESILDEDSKEKRMPNLSIYYNYSIASFKAFLEFYNAGNIDIELEFSKIQDASDWTEDEINEVLEARKSICLIFKNAYEKQLSKIQAYDDDFSSNEGIDLEIESLVKEKDELKSKLDDLIDKSNVIYDSNISICKILNDYLNNILKPTTDTQINYNVISEFDESELNLILENNKEVDKIQEMVLNDIISIIIKVSLENSFSSEMFSKIIFWINGYDEIEKVPFTFQKFTSNSINLNILTIAMITSAFGEYKKCFDYVFVTGNDEKIYDTFFVNYTKQPIDSIVINHAIKSKGFSKPFKIYKSDLEEIQSPNFIDDMLN